MLVYANVEEMHSSNASEMKVLWSAVIIRLYKRGGCAELANTCIPSIYTCMILTRAWHFIDVTSNHSTLWQDWMAFLWPPKWIHGVHVNTHTLFIKLFLAFSLKRTYRSIWQQARMYPCTLRTNTHASIFYINITYIHIIILLKGSSCLVGCAALRAGWLAEY